MNPSALLKTGDLLRVSQLHIAATVADLASREQDRFVAKQLVRCAARGILFAQVNAPDNSARSGNRQQRSIVELVIQARGRPEGDTERLAMTTYCALLLEPISKSKEQSESLLGLLRLASRRDAVAVRRAAMKYGLVPMLSSSQAIRFNSHGMQKRAA